MAYAGFYEGVHILCPSPFPLTTDFISLSRLFPGAVLVLARWGLMGAQYAAELRILLVFLSESLGRLGQNGGPLGAHFSLGGRGPPGPCRTAPVLESKTLFKMCIAGFNATAD